MRQFRVIIAGTRTFDNYPMLESHVDKMLSRVSQDHEIVIVSGRARGADQMGEFYASKRGYRVALYPADWETHGKRAGMIRNAEMAKNADALIAFWDGSSRGTRNMIEEATRCGLKVSVKRYI